MIERDVKDVGYEDMGWVNRPAEGGGGGGGFPSKGQNTAGPPKSPK